MKKKAASLKTASHRQKLTDQQRQAIKGLLGLLDISQREICESSEIKPPVLSRLLKDPNRGIISDAWQRLIDNFAKQVEEKKVKLEQNNKLGEANQFFNLLSEKTVEKNIQAPVGPLSPDAKNYVVRQCDYTLNKCLEPLNPVSMPCIVLEGGIMTGKTSLLLRFIKAAKSRQYGVMHVDCETILYSDIEAIQTEEESEQELYVSIIALALESLKNEPISETERQKMRKECKNQPPRIWAQRELKTIVGKYQFEYERLFLIIDGVDQLYEAANSKKILLEKNDIDSLVYFIADIRRQQGFSPLNALTIIITVGLWSFSVALSSLLRTQGYLVNTNTFTDEEAKKLQNFYQISQNDLFKLFQFFFGHPYLMNNAVFEMTYLNKTINNIFEEAEQPLQRYLTYFERINSSIESLLNTEGSDTTVLDYLKNDDKGIKIFMNQGFYNDKKELLPLVENSLKLYN